MKTHLDLYGWEIRRSKPDYLSFGSNLPYFLLFLSGRKGPQAGGSLDHIAKVLKKHFEE